jgi:hypothetical protein
MDDASKTRQHESVTAAIQTPRERSLANLRGPWKPGQSGNPNGHPKGWKSPAVILAEKLINDNMGEVVSAVIVKAKKGDMAAAKLLMDRGLPIRPDGEASPVTIINVVTGVRGRD